MDVRSVLPTHWQTLAAVFATLSGIRFSNLTTACRNSGLRRVHSCKREASNSPNPSVERRLPSDLFSLMTHISLFLKMFSFSPNHFRIHIPWLRNLVRVAGALNYGALLFFSPRPSGSQSGICVRRGREAGVRSHFPPKFV